MNKTVTDPVCGMKIDPSKAAATSGYDGTTFHFCAASCKATFEKDPSSFVREKSHGCCQG